MPIKTPNTNPKPIDSHIAEELLRLIEIKGQSWIKRSLMRIYDVYECKSDTWAVRGRRKMSDAEPLYIVEYDREKRRFKCTCQEAYKPYASSRRRACSHIGACLFYQIFF